MVPIHGCENTAISKPEQGLLVDKKRTCAPLSQIAASLILPEVFTFARQLPISGASTTFSVFSPCGKPTLSGLYLAHAISPCGEILLQGFCPTSGYSPCLAFAITNLAAPHHLGTPGFSQAFSAFPSRQVLCLAASDPLAVAPSGFSPHCALAAVTGAFRSCLFSIAGRDFSGCILLRELFHAGCVFGKPNLDPLGCSCLLGISPLRGLFPASRKLPSCRFDDSKAFFSRKVGVAQSLPPLLGFRADFHQLPLRRFFICFPKLM